MLCNWVRETYYEDESQEMHLAKNYSLWTGDLIFSPGVRPSFFKDTVLLPNTWKDWKSLGINQNVPWNEDSHGQPPPWHLHSTWTAPNSASPKAASLTTSPVRNPLHAWCLSFCHSLNLIHQQIWAALPPNSPKSTPHMHTATTQTQGTIISPRLLPWAPSWSIRTKGPEWSCEN